MSLLDVYVNDRQVGLLSPEADGAFAFSYLPDTPTDLFVSLLMPVRIKSYEWSRGLPPFFLMNLPEGYKKDLIRHQLGPQADVSDSSLLTLTGQRTIGRVRTLPHGQPLALAADPVELASVLASPDSRELLLRSLAQGVADGVSGVMPKILKEGTTGQQKATAVAERYILKTAPDTLPGLSINEYLCLEVARAALLVVPETRLSDDGNVLAIARFDRTGSGSFVGVEDFCALKGLDPVHKYKGSLEDLAKLVTTYVPAAQQRMACQALWTLLLVNYAVGNADAHLKNFAFTYTSLADVALVPAYDIVTVTAYPKWQDDLPSLTLAGKKQWTCGKLLHQFGGARLGLSKPEMDALREKVVEAVQTISPQIRQYAERYPAFREIGKRMLTAWDRGIECIQPTATTKTQPGRQLREQSGFSDDKALTAERSPYLNPDGAFSHKAR